MGTLALALLPLLVCTVDVVPGHAVVVVGGKIYHLIAPGETLLATAPENETEVLEIDFVRVSRRGKRSRPPAAHVLVGETRESVVVRSPVVEKRKPKGHPAWRASYPVRHRFPLTGGAVGGVIRIEVTATDAPDGILVALTVRAPPEGRLGLVPLTPLVPPSTTDSNAGEIEEPAPAPVDVTKEVQTSDAPASDVPTRASTPREPLENTPSSPTPSPGSEGPPGDPPPVLPPPRPSTETRPAPSSETTLDAPSSTILGDAPESASLLPVWIHVQLSPGLALQPVGGLSQLTLAFGARAAIGMREGTLSRFGLGIGIDGGREGASTRPGSSAANIRWSTTTARVRLEGEARIVSFPLGAGELSLGALAGVGMIAGGHFFSVGDDASSRVLIGPTARVAPVVGIALARGELTATVPLDVSMDLTSGVRGYWPFATTLLVGYRLAL